MPTYKIKNDSFRPKAFRVKGGLETVGPGRTRTLELSDEYSKEEIEAQKEQGVTVSSSTDEAENAAPVAIGKPLGERVNETRSSRRSRRAAEDPAETGGVTPQSEKSEVGGVVRKQGDTTTTTKPTEKQTGPVA